MTFDLKNAMATAGPSVLWLSMMATLLLARLALVGTETDREEDATFHQHEGLQAPNCSQMTLKVEFSSKVVEHGKQITTVLITKVVEHGKHKHLTNYSKEVQHGQHVTHFIKVVEHKEIHQSSVSV